MPDPCPYPVLALHCGRRPYKPADPRELTPAKARWWTDHPSVVVGGAVARSDDGAADVLVACWHSLVWVVGGNRSSLIDGNAQREGSQRDTSLVEHRTAHPNVAPVWIVAAPAEKIDDAECEPVREFGDMTQRWLDPQDFARFDVFVHRLTFSVRGRAIVIFLSAAFLKAGTRTCGGVCRRLVVVGP